MPRGVYARKSAPNAAPGAKAQPVAKGPMKKLAAPKKVSKPAKPVTPPKGDRQAKVAPQQFVAPEFLAPPSFYRSKRVAVDGIQGDDLKAYARSIGITQRDVDGLTEDRLRQNCKARIAESMED